MYQRKAHVIFFDEKYRKSAKPPMVAEAEVMITMIDINSRNWMILQVYSINIIIPENHKDYHHWKKQQGSRRVTIPKEYWDTLICYYPKKGETIRSIPKKLSKTDVI